MLKPKPILLIVAVVAIGASQLAGNESTIASFTNADSQKTDSSDEAPGSGPLSASAEGPVVDTAEQLSFDQPETSSATLRDFYEDQTADSGFAENGAVSDQEEPQAPSFTAAEPEPMPTVKQQPKTSRKAPSAAVSPASMPSNGRPDKPIDLGTPPPEVSGL